jgi:hypothetical protein
MQPRERLTSKELQVAALVWEGLTNREIARVIDTTEQVVKNTCATPLTNWASGAVWNWLSMLPATAAPGGRKSSEPWRPILRPVQSPRASDPAVLMTMNGERAKGCKTLQCNPVPRSQLSSEALQTNRLTSNSRPLNCYLRYGAWSTHQPAVPPSQPRATPRGGDGVQGNVLDGV